MWITRFSSTTLPTVMPVQEISLGSINSPYVRIPGGRVYDDYGADTAPVMLPYRITVQAEVFGTGSTSLRANLNEMRALHGQRGDLVRKQTLTAVPRETAEARLDRIQINRDSDHIQYVPITLEFSVQEAPWKGTGHSISTAFNTSGGVSVICANSGNAAVNDPIITITPAGTAMYGMTIKVSGASDLRWAGTLAAAGSLVIDCGERTVTNDGADAYDEFSLGASHAQDDWIRLLSGNTTLVITRTCAENSSAIAISYKDGWY